MAANEESFDVAIVGGGISGLAAGYELVRCATTDVPQTAGADSSATAPRFVLLEGSERFGGKVRTSRAEGLLLESGPDSLVAQKPQGLDLCRELGLADELIAPAAIEPTIGVLHRGRVVLLPRGLQMVVPTRVLPVLGSKLFSWRGKLGLVGERFRSSKENRTGDESLRDFIVRRFGIEIFDRVVEPIVGGLFTGDADRLSIELTAPRLAFLERQFGSLTRGSLELQRRASRASTEGQGSTSSKVREKPPAQWSLADGMGRLVERLIERLTGHLGSDQARCLRARAKVRGLTADTESDGWRIEIEGAPALRARSVILALPGPAIGSMLASSAPEIAESCATLDYASCAVVHLAYPRERLQETLPGFGFFVPRAERGSVLACSFPSEKFAGRAPSDRVLLRAFVGGTRSPELLERSDDELVELVASELEAVLSIRGPRVFARVERHPRSMPQFVVGYPSVIERLSAQLDARPGLFLAGSVLGAYGIPDCVASGRRAAESARLFLAGSHGERMDLKSVS